ncbi:MAG: FAD-dependent oxidoreductase [Armatimonadetes bacterium CG_4_10_14_3_um_filter_66_18]|nr:FAD-dependent oxidoreductase [Armatimonadota bacterium]OIO92818.1 MAG: protein-xanthan lyase [Armatimonadetes bacterium CG2_30_66_41]PIU90403.1 MAG: FAD-dependent oxidoreductase [Armatimonadetes bacterium CG06_land_8_20_14_3_00_66_21]PIX43016.1 MAG: FAD-dependent oxidoreductase [Armatimonadetes bacterium CG_4_8_14_3_um_filter_66_20]PIY50685.1 MAG: FAD-dependent oxidoreductase [Armatimonadetes bacterium CG_4_10_14_3_um_filter_66_18]PIZ47383.1 MAG: FAD-dependent oxidoreductase [Armatimonadete
MTAVAVLSVAPAHAAEEPAHDLVVYGGTSAGVAAAVQATRMGKSVAIVCPEKHLGGLTAGGLGWTDSGDKSVIGGFAREFYRRLKQHYDRPEAWAYQKPEEYSHYRPDEDAMWVFEPHVAEQAFEQLIAEAGVPVKRDRWLDRSGKGVTKAGGRIVAITMTDGETYRGRMFVDATYEGDLLAAAGVDYHVGREANGVYGETWNGIQVGTLHHAHYFKLPVDPYVVPGEPTSGLLPRISPDPPGEKGAGDGRVQAYCFRTCLTTVEANRVPFPKPAGYDPKQYELILRVFATGWREVFNKFDPAPNRKTDTNNHGPFSFDNTGMNYDYPEATYERRRELIEEHAQYQQGLLYFLANDPRVPGDVRTRMSRWGLAKDEFTDNGNWPHQLYVREARRMVGEYVMTEHDCLAHRDPPNSVGMGSYTLDSHNVQRYVTPEGAVQNEGDIGVGTPQPYQIAYGALTPRKAQCDNLLVPVCVSCSHIAYGSIRMEPVFMILGQSAATAACLALDDGVAVQDLSYDELRERLLADGQVLEYTGPSRQAVVLLDPTMLPGIVADNAAAKLTGDWKTSSVNSPRVGADYLHDDNQNKGKTLARFEVELKPGKYEVRLSWPRNDNRATNVPVTIRHAGGETTVSVNQRQAPAIDNAFESLGVFDFGAQAVVEVSNAETDGYVIVDAVEFVEAE